MLKISILFVFRRIVQHANYVLFKRSSIVRLANVFFLGNSLFSPLVHHLDLLNVIESLRECSQILTCERRSSTYLSIPHLKTFLTSIYINLNKRLPVPQQILHIDHCVHSAIAWLLYVYKTPTNSISFTSFRVVLILLCTGKLIEKMRHLFTTCFSMGSTQTLTYGQIDELLHEILALPYALQEISRTTWEKKYARLIFSHLPSPITWNDFLSNLISNHSKPNCLQWLIVFHRLISVENGKFP